MQRSSHQDDKNFSLPTPFNLFNLLIILIKQEIILKFRFPFKIRGEIELEVIPTCSGETSVRNHKVIICKNKRLLDVESFVTLQKSFF